MPARVVSLVPGSAAAAAGFEVGDRVLKIDGAPVAKDAYHSFNKWRSGRSVYSETFNIDGSEAATLTFNL